MPDEESYREERGRRKCHRTPLWVGSKVEFEYEWLPRFNFSSFVEPAANMLGNWSVLQLFGPMQKRLDAPLLNEFPVKEQIQLQFRTEVFNLFNETHLASRALV